MDDMTNWDNERDSIIDDTLDQLKGQDYDKQSLIDSGSTNFSPQVFAKAKTFVLGPVTFKVPFSKDPQITFGQRIGNPELMNDAGYARVAAPMIVIPYVKSFTYTSGLVDGFNLGLYAVNTPPSGAATHTVYWNAQGEGSANQNNLQSESWTESYDHNEPTYMTESATSTDDF